MVQKVTGSSPVIHPKIDEISEQVEVEENFYINRLFKVNKAKLKSRQTERVFETDFSTFQTKGLKRWKI